MVDLRVCSECRGPIGALRNSSSRFCSLRCSRNAAKNKRPAPAGWLIHSCHSVDLWEPLPPGCKCKKRVNDKQMRDMLANAEITELPGHPGQFGYVGRRKMVPRTPSIERSHIERSVVTKKPKDQRLTQSQVDELLRAREEVRLSFEQESRCRWDVYNELTAEALKAITVEVSEIVDVWEGRAIFASAIGKDDRTTFSHTVDREYLPEVFDEPDLKDEIVERDEGVVNLEDAERGEEIYEVVNA